MRVFDNDENLMSEINVTPLVDVMLVLLIIFMITAPMLTYGVKVNLPTTTSKPIPTKQEPLLITVDKNKNVFIDQL
ncbi:Biopolymer transport protein ExbD [Candidatus Methanoperedenaceae archaeon GB50]|nr:Biopolymer transport protein ExbD [Candidatus Methanoperedenaceae archaeon GB50]